MCVITWLPAFRPKVLSTRFQCSVNSTGVTINLDGVGAGDVTGDVTGEVAGAIEIMLH